MSRTNAENELLSGKNDGVVQGVRYFTCKPKHGIFVRADKLILDKRGRAMRLYKAQDAIAPPPGPMRRSISRGQSYFDCRLQNGCFFSSHYNILTV